MDKYTNNKTGNMSWTNSVAIWERRDARGRTYSDDALSIIGQPIHVDGTRLYWHHQIIMIDYKGI